MPAEPRNLPEQEQSIKAREHEVFAKPLRAINFDAVQPFRVYLRETAAEPLAGTTRIMLWITGAIVGLLFLAAIWRVTQRYGPRSRAPALAPPAKEAVNFSEFVLNVMACSLYNAEYHRLSASRIFAQFHGSAPWRTSCSILTTCPSAHLPPNLPRLCRWVSHACASSHTIK
jgi:hypothetical protein